jgi:hypothetical protein
VEEGEDEAIAAKNVDLGDVISTMPVAAAAADSKEMAVNQDSKYLGNISLHCRTKSWFPLAMQDTTFGCSCRSIRWICIVTPRDRWIGI